MSTIALVTGANKGIGREIAAQLAALGMSVLLGARDPERGEKTATDLRGSGLDVHPMPLDVTEPASVERAAAQVEERFGRLDVLVNNAGISGEPALAPSATGVEQVRAVLETNVVGVLRVSNAMLPLLRRSRAARIVNISSGTASMADMGDPAHYLFHLPPRAAYPVSKAALNALTVQYAKELREEGILVNAAAPGACDTDFTRELGMTLTRTAAQGAAIAVRLATLGPDGPTGGFFSDDGPMRW
ncbi:SDR family oxidoreductase [Spongiactinospora sp. 9N601]|uniref:SDR family oxidoreductase n=1 Tax=Spongiactinospora sp. 9N601 TaxID=3375149 RepID=UPI00378B07AB